MPDSGAQLVELLPSAAAPVIRKLATCGILDAPDREVGRPVVEHLHQILLAPRAPGLEAASICCSVLKRLENPSSNTQIINVPFADGRSNSSTCVSATRLFVLMSRKPGEYARIAQELSSPSLSFLITVPIPGEEFYRAKAMWLEGRFWYRRINETRMAIRVSPDANALERAILEESHRRFPDDSFEPREYKDSRSAIDVLCQSAFTNYALRGQYDSKTDSSRLDQSTGIPFGSIGYLSLDNDILSR